MTKRSTILGPGLGLGLALGLAGCGGGPPHSDYFVVAFLAGTPAPSQPGLEALDNAVHAARSDRPRVIAIDGAEPPGAVEPALEQARANAIAQAFAKAGIDRSRIHIDMRAEGDKGYAERKDGFIVQLIYGAAPTP